MNNNTDDQIHPDLYETLIYKLKKLDTENLKQQVGLYVDTLITQKSDNDIITDNILEQIEMIRVEHEIFKENIIEESNDTYEYLLSEFNNIKSWNTYIIKVIGFYESVFMKRTLENWKQCNIGKIIAIKCFIKKLQECDVNVIYYICDFQSSNNEKNTYYGGNVLIIKKL